MFEHGAPYHVEVAVDWIKDPESMLRQLSIVVGDVLDAITRPFSEEAAGWVERPRELKAEYRLNGSDAARVALHKRLWKLKTVEDTAVLAQSLSSMPICPGVLCELRTSVGRAMKGAAETWELDEAVSNCLESLVNLRNWVRAKRILCQNETPPGGLSQLSDDKGGAEQMENSNGRWPDADRDAIRESLSGQQLKLFNVLWGKDKWTNYETLKTNRADRLWRGQPDPDSIKDGTVFEALRKLQGVMPPNSPYTLTIENESCRVKIIPPEKPPA